MFKFKHGHDLCTQYVPALSPQLFPTPSPPSLHVAGQVEVASGAATVHNGKVYGDQQAAQQGASQICIPVWFAVRGFEAGWPQ